MKKILLSLIILILPIFLYAQTSVTISGELKPSPNQTYSYYITSGFHGVSRTNATWTVTNGHFNNTGKTTTLTQDVDIMSADVVWTTPGQTGTLKYSYTNGNSSYSGQLTVAIQGGSTGGGNNGGGNNGGGNNGNPENVEGTIEIVGPDIIRYNDEVTFILAGMDEFAKLYSYDTTLLELIKTEYKATRWSSGWKNDTYVTFRVKKNTHSSVIIMSRSAYYYKPHNINYTFWGKKAIKIHPKQTMISEYEPIICNNQTASYRIEPAIEKPNWQAGSNLTLVSGQGTSTATFKGSGNGKGVVKATVTYDGVSYPIEDSDVWVGVPPVPQSIIGFVANSTDPREMQVVPGQSYSFNLPEEKSTTGGQWTVKSLAQIEIPYREWVGGNGVFVDIPNIQSNGMTYMINISASNKNKCGISTPISRLLTFGSSDPRNRALMKTQGIESALSEPQPTSIRIYSYPTGSLVYQKKNTISFDIQNTNLGEGIYILEMTDQQGNVTREKVMKGKQ